ncbi:MFS transporter [Halalkalibacter sp. APA_J-10(15)]|uniref:MFS transporter n=1 Tax=Halalkalibacter sp. APA_J-10(15) TaxID=2933805 RepID=UPI001FF59B27|nr:MFS transporter [Halalkalibacter sp. APA_J-10(15)]MCK0473888.1 MFS transporter [Halalkalibacter sp. APA_J-10(15)]
MNIGQLILLPLTGFIIASSGFRSAFVVLGLIMLVIVVPIVLIVVKNNPTDVNQMPDGDSTSLFTAATSVSLSEALRSREFWIATLGFATCGFILYLVTMHLPNFAVDLGYILLRQITILVFAKLLGWQSERIYQFDWIKV